MIFFLSGFSFLLLFLPKNLLLFGFVFYALFPFYLFASKKQIKIHKNLKIIVVALFVSLFLMVAFNKRWESQFETNVLLLEVFSLILALFSIPFISSIIFFSFNKLNQVKLGKNKNTVVVKSSDYLFIIAVAVLTITIVSKCSFLYPFNNWTDSNIFFTVGKSALDGKVVYKDIFEHKGPFIYLLHTLASIISYDSFLGIYFFEIISCFLFLLLSYKIICLFSDKGSLYLIPILSCVVYTSSSFVSGDSAEEFCLPLITYAFYLGIKSLVYSKDISPFESLMIGVTSGIVLWCKFTMLGFYLGFIIVPSIIYIKEGRLPSLIRTFLFILIGVILSTIPFFIYFGLNNAISELLDVYFVKNITIYGNIPSSNPFFQILSNYIYGLIEFVSNEKIGAILILIGLVWFTSQASKYISSYTILCFIFSTIFLYIGGTPYIYYKFILSSFMIFAFILFNNCVKKTDKQNYIRFVSLPICVAGCFLLSKNVDYMKYKINDLPQYQIKNIVMSSNLENPTLLNYGFLDSGFYTTCGIVPNEKYFCQFNIPLQEIHFSQARCIEELKVDFVVSQVKQSFKHYIFIGEFSEPDNSASYFLYKKHID